MTGVGVVTTALLWVYDRYFRVASAPRKVKLCDRWPFDNSILQRGVKQHALRKSLRSIRRALKDGGSAKHATGVQWFFKDEIKSHGWYTADLRRAAVRFRRELRKERGLDFLIEVADHLFSGSVLEEKIAAVFLLEKLDAEFGDREFKLFDSWLDRVSSWADHDGLVHYLISPMVATETSTRKSRFPLGKIAEPLAPPGRLRGADSRSARKNVLPGDHEAVELASRRRR